MLLEKVFKGQLLLQFVELLGAEVQIDCTLYIYIIFLIIAENCVSTTFVFFNLLFFSLQLPEQLITFQSSLIYSAMCVGDKIFIFKWEIKIEKHLIF